MKRSRRTHSAPKYRLHKATGQARVTIAGKTYYLGRFGSDASREEYQRRITELWTVNPSVSTAIESAEAVTITHLAIDYALHVETYYRKNGKQTSECVVAKRILKRLRQVYGSMDAAEFDPRKYKAFRQTLINDGLARTTINHYMWHVLKMFKLGGENKPSIKSLYRDLKDVGNLLEGRSDARETDDVLPVDDDVLDATIEKLNPVLADMVRLQLLTGMRPGEVRNIRPFDVDRSLDVWTYRPPTHKNQHKKSRKAKTRIVVFGPQAQEILRPYLLRDH